MSTYISQIVKKHVLEIDFHGISYFQTQPSQTQQPSNSSKKPAHYWTMNVEQKVAFLHFMLKDLDKWLRIEKVVLGESTIQKKEARNKYNEKINLIYNHLQSYRVEIETVMDDKEHQKYIDIYIYFVNQIEDRSKNFMELTETNGIKSWFSWFF